MKIIPHPLLSPNLTSSQKLNSLSNSAADSQSHAFRVNVVQLLGVEGSGDDEPRKCTPGGERADRGGETLRIYEPFCGERNT